MTKDRRPYVGEGEDGARRSARIDWEEADLIDWEDPRRAEVIDSAERWEQQARELMYERLGRRPTLAQVQESVGSEEWLAALALADLSDDVKHDLAQWTEWGEDGTFTYEGEGEQRASTFQPIATVDWQAWVSDVEDKGRGWSSSASRLFELIAGLTIYGRTINLPRTMNFGSWEEEALRILVNWASGGNNRDRSGRYSVVPN